MPKYLISVEDISGIQALRVTLWSCRAHYRVNLRPNPFKTETKQGRQRRRWYFDGQTDKKSAPEGRRPTRVSTRVEESAEGCFSGRPVPHTLAVPQVRSCSAGAPHLAIVSSATCRFFGHLHRKNLGMRVPAELERKTGKGGELPLSLFGEAK